MAGQTDPLEAPLSSTELFTMSSRWTARNANPGRDYEALNIHFREAQDDLGRVLRFLAAFEGPPLQD